MTESLVVVDASLVIKAVLPNPDFARCQAILAHLQDRQLIAPALWIYEVTGALSKAIHYKQLTPQEGQAALHQILSLGVQVILPDETQAHLAFDQTLRLQRAAAYEGFYMVTADTLNIEFWTADRRLVNAFQGSAPAWLHSIDEIG